MWRPEGKIVNYIYHEGQSGKYGDDVDTGVAFTPGQWHKPASRTRLNEIGKTNGVLETWINGEKIDFPSEFENMVWRLSPTILTHTFFFTSFFGGHTPEWAPSKDVEASFDNFLIFGRDNFNGSYVAFVEQASSQFTSMALPRNRQQSESETKFT